MRYLTHAMLCATLCLSGCYEEPPTANEAHVTPVAQNTAAPRTADWPMWRGPLGNGTANVASVPLHWSPTENIVWKTAVPGLGHASPVVVGQGVYITTAEEESQTIWLLRYDRATGAERWRCRLHQGGFDHIHQKNSHASAAPTWHNGRLFCTHLVSGAIHVSAVDEQGKLVWQRAAGKFKSHHGYGAAAAIAHDRVIVIGDNAGSGFLAALRCDTGEPAWSVPRANAPSHATPLVVEHAGRSLVLLSGQNKVSAYEVQMGRVVWETPGVTEETANTMAASGDLAIASGGYPDSIIEAYRLDNGERVWQRKLKLYVPSPLVYENALYVVQDQGIARRLDLATGADVWSQRIEGDVSGSPVAAAGHIFCTTERGVTHVFAAGDKWQPVAANDLGEPSLCTPALCEGAIFLRTRGHLYCVGRKMTR